MDRQTIEQIAELLTESQFALAFTGAGISTESGIPDFRSAGGIWSKVQPVMFQDYLRSEDSRLEYWQQKCTAFKEFTASKPNPGHRVLAAWQQRGLLQGIITQNIDGLHQEAGCTDIVELHGTLKEIACLECGARFDPAPLVDEFFETETVPRCKRCGGLVKHATISFGQSMPEEEMLRAAEWCRKCDLIFVLGSSLVVEPAASFPRLAANLGAEMIIINRDPTPQDSFAKIVIHEGIGDTLTAVEEILQEMGKDG